MGSRRRRKRAAGGGDERGQAPKAAAKVRPSRRPGLVGHKRPAAAEKAVLRPTAKPKAGAPDPEPYDLKELWQQDLDIPFRNAVSSGTGTGTGTGSASSSSTPPWSHLVASSAGAAEFCECPEPAEGPPDSQFAELGICISCGLPIVPGDDGDDAEGLWLSDAEAELEGSEDTWSTSSPPGVLLQR